MCIYVLLVGFLVNVYNLDTFIERMLMFPEYMHCKYFPIGCRFLNYMSVCLECGWVLVDVHSDVTHWNWILYML